MSIDADDVFCVTVHVIKGEAFSEDVVLSSIRSRFPLKQIKWKSVVLKKEFTSQGIPAIVRPLKPSDALRESQSYESNTLPIFHLCAFQCKDLSEYRQARKVELQQWVSQVEQICKTQNSGWLLVHVTPSPSKVKGVRLNTNSLLSKIKSDFGSKGNNDCVIQLPHMNSAEVNDSVVDDVWKRFLSKLQSGMLDQLDARLQSINVENLDDILKDSLVAGDPVSFMDNFLHLDALALHYQCVGLFEEATIIYKQLLRNVHTLFDMHAADIPSFPSTISSTIGLVPICFSTGKQPLRGLGLSPASIIPLREKLSSFYLQYSNPTSPISTSPSVGCSIFELNAYTTSRLIRLQTLQYNIVQSCQLAIEFILFSRTLINLANGVKKEKKLRWGVLSSIDCARFITRQYKRCNNSLAMDVKSAFQQTYGMLVDICFKCTIHYAVERDTLPKLTPFVFNNREEPLEYLHEWLPTDEELKFQGDESRKGYFRDNSFQPQLLTARDDILNDDESDDNVDDVDSVDVDIDVDIDRINSLLHAVNLELESEGVKNELDGDDEDNEDDEGDLSSLLQKRRAAHVQEVSEGGSNSSLPLEQRLSKDVQKEMMLHESDEPTNRRKKHMPLISAFSHASSKKKQLNESADALENLMHDSRDTDEQYTSTEEINAIMNDVDDGTTTTDLYTEPDAKGSEPTGSEHGSNATSDVDLNASDLTSPKPHSPRRWGFRKNTNHSPTIKKIPIGLFLDQSISYEGPIGTMSSNNDHQSPLYSPKLHGRTHKSTEHDMLNDIDHSTSKSVGYIQAQSILEPTFPFTLQNNLENRLLNTLSTTIVGMCHSLDDSLVELLMELGYTIIFYSQLRGMKRKIETVLRVLAAVLLMKNNYYLASILYKQLIRKSKDHGWNLFEVVATMGLCVCYAHQHRWKNVFVTIFHLLLIGAPKSVCEYYWSFLKKLSSSTQEIGPLRDLKLIDLKKLECRHCISALEKKIDLFDMSSEQKQLFSASTFRDHHLVRQNSRCICTHYLGQSLQYDVEFDSRLPITIHFSRAELVFESMDEQGTTSELSTRDCVLVAQDIVLEGKSSHTTINHTPAIIHFSGFANHTGVFTPSTIRLVEGAITLEVDIKWKGSMSVVSTPDPIIAISLPNTAAMNGLDMEKNMSMATSQVDSTHKEVGRESTLLFFGLKGEQQFCIGLKHRLDSLHSYSLSMLRIEVVSEPHISDEHNETMTNTKDESGSPTIVGHFPTSSVFDLALSWDIRAIEEALLLYPFNIIEIKEAISIEGATEQDFIHGSALVPCFVGCNTSKLVPPVICLKPQKNGESVPPILSQMDVQVNVSGLLQPPNCVSSSAFTAPYVLSITAPLLQSLQVEIDSSFQSATLSSYISVVDENVEITILDIHLSLGKEDVVISPLFPLSHTETTLCSLIKGEQAAFHWKVCVNTLPSQKYDKLLRGKKKDALMNQQHVLVEGGNILTLQGAICYSFHKSSSNDATDGMKHCFQQPLQLSLPTMQIHSHMYLCDVEEEGISFLVGDVVVVECALSCSLLGGRRYEIDDSSPKQHQNQIFVEFKCVEEEKIVLLGNTKFPIADENLLQETGVIVRIQIVCVSPDPISSNTLLEQISLSAAVSD
eukprot:m.44215 g.44215  ORF g.44215 m.44215 type:complete len:1616 (+) comp7158_c0_seq1:47-4894(+)